MKTTKTSDGIPYDEANPAHRILGQDFKIPRRKTPSLKTMERWIMDGIATPSDIRAYVDTLAHDAVCDYYADPRASLMPFYLYYRVGALRFAPNAPDTSWILAEAPAHRGALSRESLTRHVRTVAQKLLLLPLAQRRDL